MVMHNMGSIVPSQKTLFDFPSNRVLKKNPQFLLWPIPALIAKKRKDGVCYMCLLH